MTRMPHTSRETLTHYGKNATGFRESTRDHDVSQNIDALLRHLPRDVVLEILDFGCGPGRDLQTFTPMPRFSTFPASSFRACCVNCTPRSSLTACSSAPTRAAITRKAGKAPATASGMTWRLGAVT